YERALRIAEFLIHEVAAGYDGRLPEHFSRSWEPLLDYNAERADDPFRPYGWTPGHSLEWARLLLAVESALGTGAPRWLVPAARRLVDVAVDHGWAADGAPGFVYTVDWHDRPVVRTRMHWVAAEAVAAAAVLSRRTGEDRYAGWYRAWWDQIQHSFIDPVDGGWHHELDPSGAASATVWSGKPDIYHAYQATAIPVLPASASVVGGVLTEAAARR
ncbi:MAG: AGE family epimerase/isomerase, partial [Jiangellaceae bacterium]